MLLKFLRKLEEFTIKKNYSFLFFISKYDIDRFLIMNY
jgi:hypothetical protein